jgi:molybdenum cofactor cytidylyltransferase
VRMGRPKALLEIEGRTFLNLVADALRDGGCDQVIVVVPEDPLLHEAAEGTGAQVVTNPDPGEGPITSLRLAIQESGPDTQGVIYHPVDHPLVLSSSVAAVVQAAKPRPLLVVPMLGDERGHPTYFDAELFAEFLDPHLEGGARTVVHRHLNDAVLVSLDDEGIRADIDTPALYAELVGSHSDRPSEGTRQ